MSAPAQGGFCHGGGSERRHPPVGAEGPCPPASGSATPTVLAPTSLRALFVQPAGKQCQDAELHLILSFLGLRDLHTRHTYTLHYTPACGALMETMAVILCLSCPPVVLHSVLSFFLGRAVHSRRKKKNPTTNNNNRAFTILDSQLFLANLPKPKKMAFFSPHHFFFFSCF